MTYESDFNGTLRYVHLYDFEEDLDEESFHAGSDRVARFSCNVFWFLLMATYLCFLVVCQTPSSVNLLSSGFKGLFGWVCSWTLNSAEHM